MLTPPPLFPPPHFPRSEASAPSFYAFGVVLLQLLTEQGPLGLISAVKEAMEGGSALLNLVPRLPASPEMQAWALCYCQLAIRCTQPASLPASSGGVASLEGEVLPALKDLSQQLAQLGTSAMSWEKVRQWG